MALVLCIIVIIALAAYLTQPPPSEPPQVGIFYYTWYNPDWAFSWNQTKIVDTPILGYYNSCDPTIIGQHLRQIENLGVDFVVISWWGCYDAYGAFTDNATEQVFRTAESLNSTLNFMIMVEPFNPSSGQYGYEDIYSHIYDNYVTQYPSLYYNKTDKPAICFFNNETLTKNGVVPDDDRFNVILVGQQPYTDWIYTDLNSKDYRPMGNYQVAVTPRYDESHLKREGNVTVDIYLNEGTYDNEWNNAIKLWQQRSIDTILISTWNEFPERTAIEPHSDATATNQSTHYLYDKTRFYIAQIEQ